MHIGVLFALVAYGAYACGDALIKGIGPALLPSEIAFWTTIVSLVPVFLFKPKSEKTLHVFRTTHPFILHSRALISFSSVLFVVYAFTHIPLAEAYALIFLTPIFISILAVVVLKEEMTQRRWIALILGFMGVMLVVRPGFRELQPGHFAAIACSCLASIAAIQLRIISGSEKRITIVGYSAAYSIVLNGLLVLLIKGAHLPNPTQLALLTATGTLGGIGHIMIIAAAKNAPAAWVAQTQYSQIVWAIVLGAAFYNEFPSPLTLTGIVIVAMAGMINVRFERARTWFGTHVVASRRWRARQQKTTGSFKEPAEPNTD